MRRNFSRGLILAFIWTLTACGPDEVPEESPVSTTPPATQQPSEVEPPPQVAEESTEGEPAADDLEWDEKTERDPSDRRPARREERASEIPEESYACPCRGSFEGVRSDTGAAVVVDRRLGENYFDIIVAGEAGAPKCSGARPRFGARVNLGFAFIDTDGTDLFCGFQANVGDQPGSTIYRKIDSTEATACAADLESACSS